MAKCLNFLRISSGILICPFNWGHNKLNGTFQVGHVASASIFANISFLFFGHKLNESLTRDLLHHIYSLSCRIYLHKYMHFRWDVSIKFQFHLFWILCNFERNKIFEMDCQMDWFLIAWLILRSISPIFSMCCHHILSKESVGIKKNPFATVAFFF